MNLTIRFSLSLLLVSTLIAFPAFASDLAQWGVAGDRVAFTPADASIGYRLTVGTPDGEVYAQAFAAGELPSFRAIDDFGQSLGDGSYTFELVALAPVRDRQDAASLAEGGSQTTYASMVGGAFVAEALEEPTTKDNVIADDLIVEGSACIGIDCSNGESFGFDTLRLKENNLRIKFEDTSASASFPGNDWQITANESSNGGADKFSIDDIDGGKTPFTIEAGAPNNTLYAENDGDVGIKTANPVVDLHIVEGNSPTLRLEQDGSDGFTAQTWDIAGNETNFFIRDVTNSSKLPFRIKPSAPTDSLFIAANGNVGLGDDSPDAALDIESGDVLVTSGNVVLSDGNVALTSGTISVTGTSGAATDLLTLTNNGPSRFALANSASSGATWRFNHASDGHLRIAADNGSSMVEFDLDQSGNLVLSGSVTAPSDRNLKEDFETVDPTAVLDAIASMPMTTWSYKQDNGSKRHMGPMAQDFWAAFGLGMDDKHITVTDMSGVALAAIQGLEARNGELAEQNAALTERLEALEAMIETLAAE